MESHTKDKNVKKHKKRKTNEIDEHESNSKRAKFKISLDTEVVPETVKALKKSKKGPKILIAQEPTVSEESKPRKEKKKKRKNPTKLFVTEGDDEKNENAEKPANVHESKGMNKALRYLKMWTDDRQNWKFEKCRQIWLIQNVYNQERLNAGVFPSLLLYMESMKGGMRQMTLETAQKKVEKGEEWQEMVAGGKTEEEVTKALGEKISEQEFDRATKIVETLIE